MANSAKNAERQDRKANGHALHVAKLIMTANSARTAAQREDNDYE